MSEEFRQNNTLPVIGEKIEDQEFEVYHDKKIKKMKFSDFKNKWLIVMFYPADFTFVCPTELEELAEHYDQIKELGGDVLSVSTDTAFVHKAWHDNSPAIKKIKFPMVADPTAKIAKQFGVYLPQEGLALRGTFIIDPKAVLTAYEVNDNSIGRSAAEIVRKLQAAIYVRKHKGQVCPASWKPGGKTLTPGVDLIGKI